MFGCPHAVILSLSNGFKLSFKKSCFFLGFLVIHLKDYEYLNTYICLKHRELWYIYEIIAKNEKKGTFATKKIPIFILSNWRVVHFF